MNHFLFVLFLLPAGGAWAQHETLPVKPFSKKPLPMLEQPRPFNLEKPRIIKADTATPDFRKSLDRYRAAAWLAQARLSHTTDQGKLYLLPIDNMPCLVPDTKKVIPMPGIRPSLKSRMPNGFRNDPVVPKGRK
jgi:hypothetical protein